VSLFIVSMAAHAVVASADRRAEMMAGHSLGEYSALCAAGAFDFETGLDLVKARGEAIGEAAEKTPGTMAAVIGLDRSVVEDLCAKASAKGGVSAGQLQLSRPNRGRGDRGSRDEAVLLAQAAGSPKSVRLNVSGAFHSSLMKPAADKMAHGFGEGNHRRSRGSRGGQRGRETVQDLNRFGKNWSARSIMRCCGKTR
jgi:[acyl-carrier-protein] S-malonyltransferase